MALLDSINYPRSQAARIAASAAGRDGFAV